ncbi:hypothetical protein TNCV_2475031 [Trichonephila clavipes]|nr:hypothetical protein TNCV_2475031 [Trichonephila clavipes]
MNHNQVTRTTPELPPSTNFHTNWRRFEHRHVAAVDEWEGHEKWRVRAFKADRSTSKRIRYRFITVKSTTLIKLNSPRKNTTLPAIKSVVPGRTNIPV